MSDSLMTVVVESHSCPSHKFILLTQGQIQLKLVKKYWKLTVLKNIVFSVGHFGWVEILMIILVSSPWGLGSTFMHRTVGAVKKLLSKSLNGLNINYFFWWNHTHFNFRQCQKRSKLIQCCFGCSRKKWQKRSTFFQCCIRCNGTKSSQQIS